MHELLEIILDDLYDMSKKGEIDTDTLQKIYDMIEKREYEYSEMVSAREDDWIGRINKALEKDRNE